MITKIYRKLLIALSFIICHLSFSVALTSCASEFDNDYQVSKPSVVSETEELCSYGPLLEYATYRLGNTLSTAAFLEGGPATTQTLTNFNELTLTDAFLHSRLVAAEGSVDSSAVAQIAEQAQEKGISLFGSALCSSANVNVNYLNGLIAPDLIELEETTGTDVWGFEDDELGTTYEVKTAAGVVKGTAVIEDDPEGQSGHVVHVTKTNQSFPIFTLNLPEGRKLGDYKKLRIDFKGLNKTAVTQGIVLILAGKNTELKKAADYGCEQGVWGRGIIEFDLSVLSLTDEQNALTTVELQMGPKLVNCDYLMDNITLEYTYKPSYYQEKTAEEIQQIISAAMQKYISAVVGAGKGIDAWIVADRPVTSPDSANIWKSAIGADYVATAARYARHANSSAKLFVSETIPDLDTAQALASYISHLTSDINGIDVCVALDAETFTAANLTNVLTTLVPTGKQIRLNIQSFTASDDAAAAGLIGSAAAAYQQTVPAGQRYGISFAAVNESATNAGLWTSGFNRKKAYASFAGNLQ